MILFVIWVISCKADFKNVEVFKEIRVAQLFSIYLRYDTNVVRHSFQKTRNLLKSGKLICQK